jgi:hypothetical protein
MNKKIQKGICDKEVIINAIENARIELETAREFFEGANNPLLVDYAIFNEHAAKSKYAYFLSIAKQNGVISEKNQIKMMDVG